MTEDSGNNLSQDSCPTVNIRASLRSLGETRELIRLAKQQNYNVKYIGGMHQYDVIICWHADTGRPQQSFKLVDSVRYFRKLVDG